MKRFIVCNAAGDILRTGRVSNDRDFADQAGEDEFVIEGVAHDLDHRIDMDTMEIVPAPEIRIARDVVRQAQLAVEEAKRQDTIARLEAILRNGRSSSHIKILAELELERLQ